MQKGIWAFAIMILAGSAWWYVDRTSALANSAPPPKPIVFDNDNVPSRIAAPQPEVPQQTVQAKAKPKLLPYGALRKCVREGETTYTNDYCPAGFKEGTVDAKQMTVMPSTEKANSAAGASLANLQ